MSSRGVSLNWIFLPHAHEWQFNRTLVAAECRRSLKLDPDAADFNQALINKLRTKTGMLEIKKLYSGMNSNGTSMSLYVGPRTADAHRVVLGSKNHSVGWLLSGDAPLNRKENFQKWSSSFASVAGFVGHLMLPHHGAAANFNKDLLSFSPKSSPFVTVDKKDFGDGKRPPRKVRDLVGSRLLAVTERRDLSEVSEASDGRGSLPDFSGW